MKNWAMLSGSSEGDYTVKRTMPIWVKLIIISMELGKIFFSFWQSYANNGK
jgi:hypothetical protein